MHNFDAHNIQSRRNLCLRQARARPRIPYPQSSSRQIFKLCHFILPFLFPRLLSSSRTDSLLIYRIIDKKKSANSKSNFTLCQCQCSLPRLCIERAGKGQQLLSSGAAYETESARRTQRNSVSQQVESAAVQCCRVPLQPSTTSTRFGPRFLSYATIHQLDCPVDESSFYQHFFPLSPCRLPLSGRLHTGLPHKALVSLIAFLPLPCVSSPLSSSLFASQCACRDKGSRRSSSAC